jgi:NADPH-dependent 2,4-dienoyl-CoA reductase/sulfur reductase-like enzyme
MEFALTAHEAGHQVTLYEKGGELGGAMNWAGNYRNLPNMEQIRYQPEWHRRMIEKAGIEVRLGQPLVAEQIVSERPDLLIVATGAVPALPRFAGVDAALKSGFALTIDELLKHGTGRLGSVAVLIWGAGEGIELAIDLARAGFSVRLVDPKPKLVPASYIGSRTRAVTRWAVQAGIVIEPSVELLAVEPGFVRVKHGGDDRLEEIRCASLVLAPGRASHDPLSREMLGSGIEVQVIGDARIPRSYGNAIHEAAYLARRI